MRITSPAVSVKDIWDALVADFGVAGSYGILVETNLDGKVSLAKANLTTLETRLSAARATKLDSLDAAISSRLAAADYKQLTKGLTEHAALMTRAYGDLAAETYEDLLDVTAAGYLTGLWLSFHLEAGQLNRHDIIIEVDGSEVAPFDTSATAHGNIGTPGEGVCFLTTWDTNWIYILMCTPMYRFDTSLKIRIYQTNPSAAYAIGVIGNVTYLTE